MEDSKVHSFTLYEPVSYPLYGGVTSHENEIGSHWNYNTAYHHDPQHFDVTKIQPTPYMANLMDEYLFSPPQLYIPVDNTPKIVSVVISPADTEEPVTPVTPKEKKIKVPIKSPIRSSTGCYICRLRHIKCDERRPRCIKCSMGNLDCDFPESYSERPIYLRDWKARQEKLREIKERRRSMSNHSHSETE